jgi:hypothetical protein
LRSRAIRSNKGEGRGKLYPIRATPDRG